ncbi:hypothetical protein GBAR_LOCUS27519 [Geodia barretti]|uniref:Uncharacterized protein n=1 Tax=Geodia barretti TaxID=519541 RepID=A0AA35TN22_GEOBA|nr:hypothetical protein GBAR_LOCUS27519 [Geodia barretti]
MRRLGGRGGDRRKGVNFERESGGDGRGREGEGEGGEEGDENDKRNRRRRRRGREGEDEEDDCEGGRYRNGYGQEGDDLEAAKSGSLGDLMRFKSKKRDDVKVLKATLKELKDIDPLDYLARYCIIDQQKVPHYRRVY